MGGIKSSISFTNVENRMKEVWRGLWVLKLAIVKRCPPQRTALEMEFTPIDSAHHNISAPRFSFSVFSFVIVFVFNVHRP